LCPMTSTSLRSGSTSRISRVPHTLCNGKFEIGQKLGAGCFGEVYRAVNTETRREVAVKFEDNMSGVPQLEHEAAMLNMLRKEEKPEGFPEYFYSGKEGNRFCMVMECLGHSLENKVQQCKGHFSVKTTVLVADQVLRRIEYLHSRCLVHRDIKPENFVWGVKDKESHLYIIDFGLSKRYFANGHAKQGKKLSLTGTARYASINAHKGLEQSRRDDLEAIGHMLLYFLRGSLPWSGLDAKNKQEKYRKIREKKENTPLEDLCRGFPEEFRQYLQYARTLGFAERPDYLMMRSLFQAVRLRVESQDQQNIEDYHLEWLEGRPALEFKPLAPHQNLQQPDDLMAKSGGGAFCFCGGRPPREEN